MTRYFKSTDEILAQVNAQLDAAYGYPNEATKTASTLPPASECPHDADGHVYLAIDTVYCDYVLPSEMLPQLLSAGIVEEVDESAYQSLLPPV